MLTTTLLALACAPAALPAPLPAAVPSAAPAPTQCPFDLRIEVVATVSSIPQSPPAPFAAAAVGDATTMNLAFGADIACGFPGGLTGLYASTDCCTLDVGGASVDLDSSADPCNWGESYVSPSFFVEYVEAVPEFLGVGQIRLRIDDPSGTVGVGAYDMVDETLVVANVTAPGFNIAMELVDPTGAVLMTFDVLEISGEPGFFGFGGYCGSNANSTGFSSVLYNSGSLLVSDNDLTLNAIALPQNSFMFFLASQTQAMVSSVPNSEGILCLGGSIGRFVGAGQIQFSGPGTSTSLGVDLTQMPQPMGPVAVLPGDTWNFTGWYRDTSASGAATSNFTTAISLTFQ